MKVVSVKCPECGATLQIEEDRKQAFCTYCGAKVPLENENEYVFHHIDEAQVKQAETDQMVRLRQMELEEKQQAQDKKFMGIKIVVSLVLGVAGLIMMAVGLSGNESLAGLGMAGLYAILGVALIWIFSGALEQKERERHDGKISFPSGADEYEKKNYATVEAAFVNAGFTNVRCIPLNDLSMGLLKKPGKVASITINGEEVDSGRYYPDAPVVISYHSLSR